MAGVRSIIALAFGCAFGITFLVLSCVIPEPDNCLPLAVLPFYLLAPIPFLIARRAGDISFDTSNSCLETAVFVTIFLIMSAFGLPVVLAHAGKITWSAVGLALSANVVVFICVALCVWLLVRQDF